MLQDLPPCARVRQNVCDRSSGDGPAGCAEYTADMGGVSQEIVPTTGKIATVSICNFNHREGEQD